MSEQPPGGVSEAAWRGYWAKVVDTIDEYGWMVQACFPSGDDPEDGPGFSYTVGLSSSDDPEFIVFGLDYRHAAAILNELGRRQHAGADYQAGEHVHGLTEHAYTAVLVAVQDPCAHLVAACALYGEQGVKALQVVFQDREYRWPWQDAYEREGWPLLGPVSAPQWGR